jgi:hypothetical protein
MEQEISQENIDIINNIFKKNNPKNSILILRDGKIGGDVKLNLNLNPIGDEGFSRIARGIQDIETLRIITLAQTNITHLSMPILSQSLANKRFLTKLLLDNNKIGPVGA